jgi:hypothetical protein
MTFLRAALLFATLLADSLCTTFRFADQFSHSSMVPEGAALVFAAPHRSLQRWSSAVARAVSPFAVAPHRAVRVLLGGQLISNPFVSRRAEWAAQGVSTLECGIAALAESSCRAAVFPDGSETDHSACFDAIYRDQTAAVLKCVEDIPRPVVVIFDTSSLYAINVARKFGVPAVLVHSQLDSADDSQSAGTPWLVSRLWSHKAVHDQCALLGLSICWPSHVHEFAHEHNELVLDWFDGDSAHLDDNRGVLRVLPLANDDDFRYQAALDITDDSEAVTKRFLDAATPFVFVSFGDVVQPTVEFIQSVVKQLAAACQSGSVCRVLWAAGARRGDADVSWPSWITAIHTALPHFGVFASKRLRAVVTGGDSDEIGDAIVNNVPLVVVPLRADTHRNAAFVTKRGIGAHVRALDTLGAALAPLAAGGASDVRQAMQQFHDKWRAANTHKVVQSAVSARILAASPVPPPPAPILAGNEEADENAKRVARELASWKTSMGASKRTEL